MFVNTGSELELCPKAQVLKVCLASIGDVLETRLTDLCDVVGEIGDVIVIAELLSFDAELENASFKVCEGSGDGLLDGNVPVLLTCVGEAVAADLIL